MKEYLQQYFEDPKQEAGLLVVQAPTGYGKTYQTVRAIYDYVHSDAYERPVIFTTNLIKNLPEEDFRNLYAEHGNEAAFEKEVLVLRSNFDSVDRAIRTTAVPKEFQSDAYISLRDAFEQLDHLAEKRTAYTLELEQNCRDKIRRELEPAFRREIEKLLRNYFSNNVQARKDAIRNNRKFQWIGKLYPAVFTEDCKILMLTVRKMMCKNTVVTEPSYSFLSERILKNRIVCIDEFDASKADMLQMLIDHSLNLSEDYLKLFLQIQSSFHQHQISQGLAEARNAVDSQKRTTYEVLMKKADRIFQDFSLQYSIKTAEENPASGRNFLFYDRTYHAVLSENRSYIRTVQDDEQQQLLIHFDTQEEYQKHVEEPNLNLCRMLREIYTFLCSFKRYVSAWAEEYAKQINAEQKENLQDVFTIENAEKSIYGELNLSYNQVLVLRSEIGNTRFSAVNRNRAAPDFSFYAYGFQLFEFTDADSHKSQTQLEYLQLKDMPEKILLFICRYAHVVGLSATASMPTVTGNYDLQYLQQQLGRRYQVLPQQVTDRIKEELQQIWTPYREGKIKVDVHVVDQGKKGMPVQEQLEAILPKGLVNVCYGQLAQLGCQNEYYQQRYCNLISVFSFFWKTKEVRSMLCLNGALPQKRSTEMNETFLCWLFEMLQKNLDPAETGYLEILRSGEDFEEKKERIQENLKNGAKVLILSSYQTLSAGQNLQYTIPKGCKVMHLPAKNNGRDARFLKKDVDALYLGDVTNTAVNLYGNGSFTEEQLFEFCIQVESLYQNNEISAQQLNELLKAGLRRVMGIKPENAGVSLKRTQSIRRQVTRDVLQAIGRICRTYSKSSVIHIMTTEATLYNLDPDCVDGMILCPEAEALLSKCRKSFCIVSTAQNEAERICLRGCRYIMNILLNTWTAESMRLWKVWRETAMRLPNANKIEWEQDPIVRCFYLPTMNRRPRYVYAEMGDFADVQIRLDAENTDVFSNLPKEYRRGVVSEDEARLQTILNFPGMRQHFEQQNWATSFKECDYILSPVMFQNIYKGALGELAGKFILEQGLGLTLTEIEEPDCFEKFDYRLKEDVYVDFKHWKPSALVDDMEMRRKISQKLDDIGGKRAYIINILGSDRYVPTSTLDGRIVEIPALLTEDGRSISPMAIEQLKEELF